MTSCKNLYVQFRFTDNQKAKGLNFTYKNLNYIYQWNFFLSLLQLCIASYLGQQSLMQMFHVN